MSRNPYTRQNYRPSERGRAGIANWTPSKPAQQPLDLTRCLHCQKLYPARLKFCDHCTGTGSWHR